jgi:hypothetical protein
MPRTNICVVVTIDVVVRAVLAVKEEEVMVTVDVPRAAALVTISRADGDNNVLSARTTKKSAVH